VWTLTTRRMRGVVMLTSVAPNVVATAIEKYR
jgi:hypothetical protein